MRRDMRYPIILTFCLLALLPSCTPARPLALADPLPATATHTSQPTDTPAPTGTHTPSATATETPTETPSPSATPTETLAPTATATETPLPTATPTVAATPTQSPPPRVVASFPIDGDYGVPADAPLQFVFTTPMNTATINAGLRIEPPVAGVIEQTGPTEFIFRAAGWQPATDYIITLTGARSVAGRTLPEWRIRFATHADGRVPLPILMYHRITPLPADASAATKEWATSPDSFIAHLDYLRDAGYAVISLDELIGYLTVGHPLPAQPVTITFDDGYVDFYDTAWPALKERDFTASMFVISSHVGYGAFLTWDQLAQIEMAGIAIGSHSLDHTGLKGLAADEMMRQVKESKEALDAHLQTPITWMTYPYGSYDANAIVALSEAGYNAALTINPSRFQVRGQPYRLNRIHAPYDATIDQFAALLR